MSPGTDAHAGVAAPPPSTAARWSRGLAVALVGAVSLTLLPAAAADARVRVAAETDVLAGVAAGRADVQACADMDPHGTATLSEVSEAVGADVVRRRGVDGAGVDIAVIDTGVNEVGGLEGQVVEGVDLSFDHGNDALRGHDLHGHGTAMASIAASRGGAGGDGVAPGARIIDVKVGAGNGEVDVSQVIAAIDWVIANKDTGGRNIRVLNLAYNTDSRQSYELDPLALAVENAWDAGIVVVVAGGNDGKSIGRLGNPATSPRVIAVGAAEDKGRFWRTSKWSSTGDGRRNPDVVAPGADVLSAGVDGSFLVSRYEKATCAAEGDLYLRGSGTSQAAAVVAGASALVVADRPELGPDQVKHLLTSTARRLGKKATQEGAGMIDVPAALAASTPGAEAVQPPAAATGLGSLDAARGSKHVGQTEDVVSGEVTAFGTAWDAAAWAVASREGRAWVDTFDAAGDWSGATWSGATWSGATWSGATWSGATWSGATWSGATWSGATWCGATWSGATWSGATWSGATWSGATWSGATWSGATWTGASWTGASWT